MTTALLQFARLGGLPPFRSIHADDVEGCITTLLSELQEGQQALEARLASAPSLTFDDVIGALQVLTEPLERAWGVVGHLLAVRNAPALRTAHERMQPAVVAAMMSLAQSEAIYAAWSKLSKRDDLDDVQRRVVDKKLLEARIAGIALAPEQRVQFNAIETELSELATQFSNHVLDATKAWAWLINDADELDGVPPSARAQLAANAKRAGHDHANAEQGPWLVGLDAPSFQPVVRYAHRSSVRQKVYLAYLARASDLDGGAHDNRPLIGRIRALRQQKAALLGFEHYAALSVSQKMAGTVAKIQPLLRELHAASFATARAELAELEAMHGGPLHHWDVEYRAEQLREQRYAYSDEELRAYFPLPRVLDGLFALAHQLFDVRVQQDPAVTTWHEDVRFYDVWIGDRKVAGFFLDPYARPEDKRGGAWMDDCIGRARMPDGSTRIPIAYLCCNQAPPANHQPSLMTFRDVETLFHEFGHGLQHMLSNVDVVDVSGIRGVEWDAVELPSQFMENWCLHPPVVKAMSQHVDTSETLPDALLQTLRRAKNFRSASMMVRQLFFAELDLALHTHSDDAMAMQASLAKTHSVLPMLATDRFLCGFTHIFAGGYAAGYYSYKWAEVLSADAFAAFEEGPGLDDDVHVKTIGRRFRNTVLGLGGSAHPMMVFKAFRGREPTTTALLRHAGLAAS
jgi:oligopeptidase A